jgi:hypothetical protein
MLLPFEHEVVARGLHRFVFPSQSRKGLHHEVLVDLEAAPADRISCLCEASLYGRLCKHKRLVITGVPFLPRGGPVRRRRPRARQALRRR